MKILTIAHAYFGPKNISGGDFIFVNYNKQWQKLGVEIKIITNECGKAFCLSQGLKNNDIGVVASCYLDAFGVYIGNALRTIKSLFSLNKIRSAEWDYIFSASDFLPDVIPCIYLKLLHKKVKWIAAFYVFAPPLNTKNYKSGRIRLFIYIWEQRISLYFIKKYADVIFTSSKEHINNLVANKTVAIRGGIDLELINSESDVLEADKNYGAVYMGRLHPQKNPVNLLEIWKQVLIKNPGQRLAIIGQGTMEKEMREFVKSNHLELNVKFCGTRIGQDKVRILKRSKIFISASMFDSGNLALDEALACKIPGIKYDIPLEDYPKGVIKIEHGNKEKFVDTVISLLDDQKKRKDLGQKGYEFTKDLDWEIMAKKALGYITI